MKKVLFFLLVMVLAIGGYIGYNLMQTGKMLPPEVATEKAALPVLFLYEEKTKYNPMMGHFNEQDTFQIKDSVAYLSKSKASLYSDKTLEGEWTMEILDPLTQGSLGSYKMDVNNGKSLDQGMVYTLSMDAIIKQGVLKDQQKYVLRIKGMLQKQPIFYYQTFYYTAGYMDDWVNLVSKASKKYIGETKTRALMAPPIWTIKSGTSQSTNVEFVLTYTIAERADYEFSYTNYEVSFHLKHEKSKTTLGDIIVKVIPIKSPALNQSNVWEIDGMLLSNTSGTSVSSENGRYEVIDFHQGNGLSQGLYRGLYMLDHQTNQLSQIYKVDRLNSDYVWDANNRYEFRVLQVTNEGVVTYGVIGYMNGPVYTGYQGISVFKWVEKHHQSIPVMMATSYMTLEQLRELIDRQSYYENESEMWYFFSNHMLTGLNLKTGRVDRIESYPDGKFDQQKGIIYWEEKPDKHNESVSILNLNKVPLWISTQKAEGKQTKVLLNIPEGLVIGTYTLNNTLEKLSGEVLYLYDQVNLLSPDGSVIWSENSANDHLLANIRQDIKSSSVVADEGHFVPLIDASPEKSLIKYVQTTTKSLFPINETEKNPTIISVISPNNATSAASIQCIQGEMLAEDKTSIVSHDIAYGTYEIYQGDQYVSEETSLQEALLLIKKSDKSNTSNYRIYYKDTSLVRTLIYADKQSGDTNQIKNVPVIAQRPELPRGCEVTSSAMLLKYYGIEVNKMQLAQEVAYDLTPKTVQNGFISFGDLNEGFVGSMSDVALPGLGVYHKPIYELLNAYLPDKVYDVTGLSFNQMLSLVNAGHPVWVITPNSYAAVSSAQTQVWKTPSGYMEVTGREHSVLVTGFDGSKVYYSDPSKAIHDQKGLKSFQAGWESIGRQCIVILP